VSTSSMAMHSTRVRRSRDADAVAIPDRVARRCLPRKRLRDLLGSLLRRRVLQGREGGREGKRE
jgi:hypothetical protein